MASWQQPTRSTTGVGRCQPETSRQFHGFASPEEASTKLSMDASTFRDLFSASSERLSVSCGIRFFGKKEDEENHAMYYAQNRPDK